MGCDVFMEYLFICSLLSQINPFVKHHETNCFYKVTMSLSQAFTFKCSSDSILLVFIRVLIMFTHGFGDKIESSKNLGFTLVLGGVFLEQELLESMGLWELRHSILCKIFNTLVY